MPPHAYPNGVTLALYGNSPRPFLLPNANKAAQLLTGITPVATRVKFSAADHPMCFHCHIEVHMPTRPLIRTVLIAVSFLLTLDATAAAAVSESEYDPEVFASEMAALIPQARASFENSPDLAGLSAEQRRALADGAMGIVGEPAFLLELSRAATSDMPPILRTYQQLERMSTIYKMGRRSLSDAQLLEAMVIIRDAWARAVATDCSVDGDLPASDPSTRPPSFFALLSPDELHAFTSIIKRGVLAYIADNSAAREPLTPAEWQTAIAEIDKAMPPSTAELAATFRNGSRSPSIAEMCSLTLAAIDVALTLPEPARTNAIRALSGL